MVLKDVSKLEEVPIFNGCYDTEHTNAHFIWGVNSVMEYIKGNLPAVDAVLVVRCKDCKHNRPVLCFDNFCRYYGRVCNENEYCCKGEYNEKS